MMAHMKRAAILLAPLMLTSAIAGAEPPRPGAFTVARLGETVRIGGQRVTPLRVLEDSRCPAQVTCVWAGRVRISVQIGRATRELTLGQPLRLTHGTLLLAQVQPQRRRDLAIPPRAYRFAFRFDADGGMQLIRDRSGVD